MLRLKIPARSTRAVVIRSPTTRSSESPGRAASTRSSTDDTATGGWGSLARAWETNAPDSSAASAGARNRGTLNGGLFVKTTQLSAGRARTMPQAQRREAASRRTQNARPLPLPSKKLPRASASVGRRQGHGYCPCGARENSRSALPPGSKSGPGFVVVGRVFCDQHPLSIERLPIAPGTTEPFDAARLYDKLEFLVMSVARDPYRELLELRSGFWSFVKLPSP